MQYWIKSSSQPAVSSVLPFQRRLIYPIWGFYTLHRRMERGRCYLAKFHLSSHGVHLLKYFTLKRLQGTGAVVLIVQMLIDTEVFTKHYCIIYVVQWTSAIVSSFFFHILTVRHYALLVCIAVVEIYSLVAALKLMLFIYC